MVQYRTWFLWLFCVLCRIPSPGPIWIMRLRITAIDTRSPSIVGMPLLEAYLVKMIISTLVQSPAESRVKCVSSTNAFHMDQSSVETVLTVLDTHVYLWKIHFLFLIGACVHEWTYNHKLECNTYVTGGERGNK